MDAPLSRLPLTLNSSERGIDCRHSFFYFLLFRSNFTWAGSRPCIHTYIHQRAVTMKQTVLFQHYPSTLHAFIPILVPSLFLLYLLSSLYIFSSSRFSFQLIFPQISPSVSCHIACMLAFYFFFAYLCLSLAAQNFLRWFNSYYISPNYLSDISRFFPLQI